MIQDHVNKYVNFLSTNKMKSNKAYLKEAPYQPKNIDCPYNDDNHRRRKSAPPCKKSWLRPC